MAKYVLSYVIILCFSLIVGQNVSAVPYCAAIRGNGEAVLAHWSALSKIIENKGLPEKMSGGSSAAVSLFFVDAISRNKFLSSDEAIRNIELGLLLKTLVPHIGYIFSEDAKVPTVMRLVGNITGIKKSGFLKKVKLAAKIAKDLPSFFKTLKGYGPLLNPALVKGLREDFSFFAEQAKESASVFGDFDAKTDKNIFFREGLVDFKFLGILIGRVADFMAGFGREEVNKNLKAFLHQCRDVSFGKRWDEIIEIRPDCEKLLVKSFDSYYERPLVKKRRFSDNHKSHAVKYVREKRSFPNKMIFMEVGSGLNTFPTTAVVLGDSAKRYRDEKQEYVRSKASDVKDFVVDFDRELYFGYWGRRSELDKIAENLEIDFPGDPKSGRFYSINNGRWFEVLGTSPAEPGLSNLLRIPDSANMEEEKIINRKYFKKRWGFLPTLTVNEWFNEDSLEESTVPYRKNMYSAGGWSDLSPVLVLKASDCEEVLYLTRQGGDSVFGQQIFIRLTGDTDKIKFWKEIRARNREGHRNLSKEEEKSAWNRIYNLANPKSSFNTSLKNADAVYCTNWDSFNAFKGEIDQLVENAYNQSPVFLKDEGKRSEYNFGAAPDGWSEDNFPGCIPF